MLDPDDPGSETDEINLVSKGERLDDEELKEAKALLQAEMAHDMFFSTNSEFGSDEFPTETIKNSLEGDTLMKKALSFINNLPTKISDVIEIVSESEYESDSSSNKKDAHIPVVRDGMFRGQLFKGSYSRDFSKTQDFDALEDIAAEGDDVIHRMKKYLDKCLIIPEEHVESAVQKGPLDALIQDVQRYSIDVHSFSLDTETLQYDEIHVKKPEILQIPLNKKRGPMQLKNMEVSSLNMPDSERHYLDDDQDHFYSYDGVRVKKRNIGMVRLPPQIAGKQVERIEELDTSKPDSKLLSDDTLQYDEIHVKKPKILQIPLDTKHSPMHLKNMEISSLDVPESDRQYLHNDQDLDYDNVQVKKLSFGNWKLQPLNMSKPDSKLEKIPSFDQISVGSIKGSAIKNLENFAKGEAPREEYEKRALEILKSEAILLNCAKENEISAAKVNAQARIVRPGRPEAQNHLILRAKDGDWNAHSELAMTKIVAGAKGNVPEAIGMINALADDSKLHANSNKNDLMKAACKGDPKAISELSNAMVRLASKRQMKVAAMQGDLGAQRVLSAANALEKMLEEVNELSQRARNGDHAAVAALLEKKNEQKVQEETLKSAADSGDLFALTLLADEQKRKKDELLRKAHIGDQKAIRELSAIKHKKQSRLIQLANAGDEKACAKLNLQNKDRNELIQKAKEGDVSAILELDAQAHQLRLFQRAEEGEPEAAKKIAEQNSLEKQRLRELAHSGNSVALDVISVFEMENVPQNPSGSKLHRQKKITKKEKLRRDKYGRLVDSHGKLIQKPYTITITTKEADDYRSKITEYGPLCLSVFISILMILVMLLITDNTNAPLKNAKSKGENIIKASARSLKEIQNT